MITCITGRGTTLFISSSTKASVANQERVAFFIFKRIKHCTVLARWALNIFVILPRTKRTKMKNSCNKSLLIPWLLKALNEQLYDGLKWSDTKKKIFYVVWTHKSAEHWSVDVLEPFKAWAAHKGKLAGKNEKQLKATFRCALNSKKDELREIHRNRCQRFWQFIDPKSAEGKSGIKKRRKANNKHADVLPDESNDSHNSSFMECSSSAANSCCEDFLKPSQEKNSKKKKRRVNRKLGNPSTHSVTPNNDGNSFANYMPAPSHNRETEISRTEKLPPFQSIVNFQPLTPPYQGNEMPFNTPEHSTDSTTLLTESSRLTPPVDITPEDRPTKSRYNNNNAIDHLSSDVYNPNCWSIPSVKQEIGNSLGQFFANDFDDFGKPPSSQQDLIGSNNNNKMASLEMDQFVPVVNMVDNTFSYSNKAFYEGNHCEQVNLEDDILFSSDSPETERVLEELHSELQRFHLNPYFGSETYCS